MSGKAIVFALPLVALVLWGASPAVPGEEDPCAVDNSLALPWAELQQWGDPRTDRESCEQQCRSRYGVDPFFIPQRWGGGSYSGGYQVYANCIAACEKQFWNRFDRKMEETR